MFLHELLTLTRSLPPSTELYITKAGESLLEGNGEPVETITVVKRKGEDTLNLCLSTI